MPKSCVIIIRFEMAGDILILTSSTVFTALRIYALFHKSIYLFGLTLALGLISPIISIYGFIRSTPLLYEITPSYAVCYIETAYVTNLLDETKSGADHASTGMMGARAAAIVFDGFVLGLTWRGTHRGTALGGSHRVLMRDSA
ncbi:hypothetical protein C8Q72DRAFT_777276 [Fomitopsis betulina]|nr:hypothetical protein C8Q72DRAFT_777276 [Fomitopsis betulina]